MEFKLSIVRPDKVLYESNEVDFVTLPGKLGLFGVLKKHTPLLSALKKGKISVKAKGQEKEFEIGAGFVEVLPEGITVLINS